MEYGTHSMRRTKATLIYHRRKNLRAAKLLLGHSKLESTVRYLGSKSTMPSRSLNRRRFDVAIDGYPGNCGRVDVLSGCNVALSLLP